MSIVLITAPCLQCHNNVGDVMKDHIHDNSTAVSRVASTGKASSLSPGENAVQPHLRENEAKIMLSICSHFRDEHAAQRTQNCVINNHWSFDESH